MTMITKVVAMDMFIYLQFVSDVDEIVINGTQLKTAKTVYQCINRPVDSQ